MNVTLTPDQEKIVTEQIKSGHYQSAADVISQGLGMLRDQEEFIRSNETELRDKITVGLDQIRRGDVVDGKKAIDTLRVRLRERESGQ
jgi:antitoxin ParD1/3/4